MRTLGTTGIDPSEFFGDAVTQDPYPYYRRLRDAGPVHRIGPSGFHAVIGWDAIDDTVGRPRDFSSNLTAVMMYGDGGAVDAFPMGEVGAPVQALATADDPAHAAHRRMLIPQLSAKRIRASEPFIAETFDRLWADGAATGRIEWMDRVANQLPMMVVARLIGAPERHVNRLIRLAYASTQLLDGRVSAEEAADSGAAALELTGYIFEQFQRALDEGVRDNLMGDLATAFGRGEIDQVAAGVMMVTLFSAGGESTASLLGSAVGVLTEMPDVQEELRARPELLGTFIEECLRYEAPFRAHYRHVLTDTELGGVSLAAGSRLLLLWGAANRDPVRFDAPDEFRLDRPSAKAHLSFGKGAHFCVGAALARLEAAVVLRALLERTRWIEATEVGPWLASVLVRRRSRLEFALRQ